MKAISETILKSLGWEIKDDFINLGLDKSIIIFAPHTSYWDGIFGKLYLMTTDINYKFLSKKEFFKFPLNILFTLYGSIPVSRNKEFINEVTEVLNNNKNLHIILSPEGQLAKTDHWKKGFYYMAKRANVPIVVGYIDYKKKEIGIKGVIKEISSVTDTMNGISDYYKDVNAKYPEYFTLDKRYS